MDAYDDLGQLIREDNRPMNKSYVYIYDDAGNLLVKEEYAFTIDTLGSRRSYDEFVYSDSDWGDQMVGYQGSVYWIDYDEIGNPTRYGYGLASEGLMEYGNELTWNGRELVRFRSFEDGDTLTYDSDITYTYNADGIRTSKTVNGVEHKYYLNGSQIVAEIWVEDGIERTLIYLYDESGSPIGMEYRTENYSYSSGTAYFFEKNLQGDIVAVYDSNGIVLCYYHYDAWGNFTIQTTSNVDTTLERKIVNTYNPFRYRGYYYDIETGFYYLQSRYYNPQWGRFLNADVYVSTGQGLIGNNMYVYCNNNPVMYVDFKGDFAIIPCSVVVVGIITVIGANHTRRKNQSKKIDESIQAQYTIEEAKKEIEQILSQYIDDPVIKFQKDNFFIKDSYKVTNSFDRLRICEIVRRTGITNRSAKNMASEWSLHNTFSHSVIKKQREAAKDVNIEYVEDPRRGVRWSTKVYEIMGWS